MFKIIFLAIGLAVGFGGGVYWGHKNPEAAGKLSAEEERRFLEAQVAISQKIQAKLDQLSSKTEKPAAGSGFVSSAQSGAGGGAAPAQADVKELKSDTEKQEAELRKRIESLK